MLSLDFRTETSVIHCHAGWMVQKPVEGAVSWKLFAKTRGNLSKETVGLNQLE